MPSGTARTGGRRPPGIGLAVIAANEEVFRRDLREIHDHSTFEEKELWASLTGRAPRKPDRQGSAAPRTPTRLVDRTGGCRRRSAATGSSRATGTEGRIEEVRERNDENAELSEVFSRVHGELMEGFSSLVSMNRNTPVRTLTEIRIALAVRPSSWAPGSNVPTPFAGSRIGVDVLTVPVGALTRVTYLAIR